MIEANGVEAPAGLAAARAGDSAAFGHLVDPYHRELLVHCYRILGSLEDAEDILQETLLRAWRRLDSFEGRASLRAWLYKIATNAALDALTHRRRRGLPPALAAPADPRDPFPAPVSEPIWLEPLPDTLVDERPIFNPEARYEARESVTLAFLAALQTLPGRQRAVLILRDVLGWRAGEVAELLDTSVQAVNSALQRARTRMKQQGNGRPAAAVVATSDAQLAALLARYVAAWEEADVPTLVALLREDAVLTMPPLPVWFRGRAAIRAFLANQLLAGPARGRFRFLATRANGAPAFATYQQDAGGVYRPVALQVLAVVGGAIARLDDFLVFDDRLFTRFGLPAQLISALALGTTKKDTHE
jgi:RNA polymerase sigma-70 factor (ECF subfamily)